MLDAEVRLAAGFRSICKAVAALDHKQTYVTLSEGSVSRTLKERLRQQNPNR